VDALELGRELLRKLEDRAGNGGVLGTMFSGASHALSSLMLIRLLAEEENLLYRVDEAAILRRLLGLLTSRVLSGDESDSSVLLSALSGKGQEGDRSSASETDELLSADEVFESVLASSTCSELYRLDVDPSDAGATLGTEDAVELIVSYDAEESFEADEVFEAEETLLKVCL
jgi:hypothetical protein